MARSFVARVDGTFMCALEREERGVILQIVDEVSTLLRLSVFGPDQGRDATAALASDDPFARFEAEQSRAMIDEEPHDSAVSRLLPRASDDDEEAQEFRRLSQGAITESHLGNLAAMQASLEAHADLGDVGSLEVIMSKETALSWAKGLTILRLVLGDRMGLRSDSDFEALQVLCQGGVDMGANAEAGTVGVDFLASLYEFLTWLQESLMNALNSTPH